MKQKNVGPRAGGTARGAEAWFSVSGADHKTKNSHRPVTDSGRRR
jgi:hypothetical protein